MLYTASGVTLGGFSVSDVDTLYKWHNDQELKDKIMGFRFPVSRESVLEWINASRIGSRHPSTISLSIRREESLLGVVRFDSIDYVSRRCEFGIYLGDSGFRRVGLGMDASRLALFFIFKTIGIEKVELGVCATNSPAIKLYKKLGFFLEGVSRSSYVNFLGVREDIHRFGLTRDEFDAGNKVSAVSAPKI